MEWSEPEVRIQGHHGSNVLSLVGCGKTRDVILREMGPHVSELSRGVTPSFQRNHLGIFLKSL